MTAPTDSVGTLVLGNREIVVLGGETVLEALERAEVGVASGCRAGDCKKCLVRTEDTPPPGSQRGLRPTLVERGSFLACQARPTGRLRLSGYTPPAPLRTTLDRVEHHGTDVARLFLRPEAPMAFRAGQYADVLHPSGEARSYSLAGLASDGLLELHVRRVPDGLVSGWLHALEPGASVTVRGPFGECYYTPDAPDRRLLLAGAGTGLAPLLGIARDALAQGHRGPIDLVHGGLRPERLYLRDRLDALAADAPQLRVHFAVLEGATEREHEGDLAALALRLAGPAKDTRAYLCGDDGVVAGLRRTLFLAGTPSQEIFSDPFTPTPRAG